MFTFQGKILQAEPRMTVTSDPFSVKRTWWERLFSRPWRPFKTTKMITKQIPDKMVIVMWDRIIGHPKTLKYLADQLEGFNDER